MILATVVVLGIAIGIHATGPRFSVVAGTQSPDQDDSVKTKPDLYNEANVIDEVIWVVGDEAILKSDVEYMRLQAESEGVRWSGDPDCSIPEQIAVQKLFLHQAAIDSIEVTEGEIAQAVEQQINEWIQLIGSREKLEEYRKKSLLQIRQEMHDGHHGVAGRCAQLLQEPSRRQHSFRSH